MAVAERSIARAQELGGEEIARLERERQEAADAQKREWQIRRATIRGLPPTRWDVTFDSFVLRLNPDMQRALTATKRLGSTRGSEWMVLLYGGYGVGKTHLAYAVCNALREKGEPYRFVRAQDFVKLMRDAISESRAAEHRGELPAMTPDDWLRVYSGNFLLVIDDWGKNQGGAYQEASLFDVIDARYRLQHPTLVTTNCDLRDIDGAIVSRFSTGLIACNGEDQRRHGHGAI